MDRAARVVSRVAGALGAMALFKVNTGAREQEVCALRWDREERIRQLETNVFHVPATETNNKEDRLIVLNRVAKSLVLG